MKAKTMKRAAGAVRETIGTMAYALAWAATIIGTSALSAVVEMIGGAE